MEELWNEAGINGIGFKTNATDDEIEEMWDAVVIVGQDDAEGLKRALENNGFLCGELFHY